MAESRPAEDGWMRAPVPQLIKTKVAMCASHPLRLLVNALMTRSPSEILSVARKGLSYLAKNALRAHPERDRKSGRSQLGLEAIT